MDIGITPTGLVERFAADGIKVSERELRRRARELGCCHEIGKAMFFTPSDIDRLIAGLVTPPSKSVPTPTPPDRWEGAGLAEALSLHEKLTRKRSGKATTRRR